MKHPAHPLAVALGLALGFSLTMTLATGCSDEGSPPGADGSASAPAPGGAAAPAGAQPGSPAADATTPAPEPSAPVLDMLALENQPGDPLGRAVRAEMLYLSGESVQAQAFARQILDQPRLPDWLAEPLHAMIGAPPAG